MPSLQSAIRVYQVSCDVQKSHAQHVSKVCSGRDGQIKGKCIIPLPRKRLYGQAEQWATANRVASATLLLYTVTNKLINTCTFDEWVYCC